MRYREITSQENRTFKGWQKLLKRRYREAEGAFLAEGEVLIRDAAASGARLRELILCGTAEDAPEFPAGLPEDIPAYLLAPALYEALTQTEHGRTVMAVIEIPHWSEEDLSPRGEGARSRDLVVLDRIQDPGNLATIIRTADAAGFGGVLVLKGTTDVYSPKAVRAAAGSILRMPLAFLEGPQALFELAERLGLTTVAAGLSRAEELGEADLSAPVALVIGNEGRGVAPEILEKADKVVKIPMYGQIESLNASVAAGILMYECVRQKKDR